MATTVTDVLAGPPGAGMVGVSWRVVTVTFDASYPTGGYPFAPADAEMTAFVLVDVSHPSGYVCEYDYTNSKIKVFRTASHNHTENTAAAYTQNATTASSGAGPLSEVPNATNLAGVPMRVFVLGRI